MITIVVANGSKTALVHVVSLYFLSLLQWLKVS